MSMLDHNFVSILSVLTISYLVWQPWTRWCSGHTRSFYPRVYVLNLSKHSHPPTWQWRHQSNVFCGPCVFLLKPKGGSRDSLLLLGHTDGATATARGLGVLATHTQAARHNNNSVINYWLMVINLGLIGAASVLPPEVPETPVGSDLLQPLQVFSQLVVQTVGQHLQHKHTLEIHTHTRLRKKVLITDRLEAANKHVSSAALWASHQYHQNHLTVFPSH